MTFRLLRFPVTLLAALVALLAAGAPTVAQALESAAAGPTTVYVSVRGNDAWSGRLPDSNPDGTDGPFATLEHARDALRGSVAARDIVVRGGEYPRLSSLALTDRDSGLVIRASPGEVVRILGGKQVSGWAAVSDAAILQRLDLAARPQVRQIRLADFGITDFGHLRERGMGRSSSPAPLELFWNDAPMTLARWPNADNAADAGSATWATIAATPKGNTGDVFTYSGDRPTRWAKDDNVWVHGYWSWDWADSYEHVVGIDPAARSISTAPPYGVYGYTPGKRWYAINVLEELDLPGEYYVDRKSGLLYFWPPDGAGRAIVSLAEEPLVSIDNARNVTLDGLILEDSRGDGVHVHNSSAVTMSNLSIRNVGESGVVIDGGDHCVVRDSTISAVGERGISLSGGDRQTLTPCAHEAFNCSIHDYSRWVRTYRAGVDVAGVGIRVEHCHIYNAPHNAILLSGNDNRIEFNEIDHVCRETGDAGAFYMGRDWTMRGNVVSSNWFHDLDGVRGQSGFTEVMAVYLDDCASGTTVEKNVFERIHGRAIMIGGGRDNVVRQNLFVACKIGVHVDARAQGWAKAVAAPGGSFKLYEKLAAVNYAAPPYSVRYPALATIVGNDPSFPKGTVIAHNVVATTPSDGKWLALQDGLTDKTITVRDNLTVDDSAVVLDPGVRAHLLQNSAGNRLGVTAPDEMIGLLPKK